MQGTHVYTITRSFTHYGKNLECQLAYMSLDCRKKPTKTWGQLPPSAQTPAQIKWEDWSGRASFIKPVPNCVQIRWSALANPRWGQPKVQQHQAEVCTCHILYILFVTRTAQAPWALLCRTAVVSGTTRLAVNPLGAVGCRMLVWHIPWMLDRFGIW